MLQINKEKPLTFSNSKYEAFIHKSQHKNKKTCIILPTNGKSYSFVPDSLFLLPDLSISERSVLLFLHLVEIKGEIAFDTIKSRYLGKKLQGKERTPSQLHAIINKLAKLNYISKNIIKDRLCSLSILKKNFEKSRSIKVSHSFCRDQRTNLKELFHIVFWSVHPNYCEKSLATALGECRNTIHKITTSLVKLGYANQIYKWFKRGSLRVKNCYHSYTGSLSPKLSVTWCDYFDRKTQVPESSPATVLKNEHILFRYKYLKNNVQIKKFEMRFQMSFEEFWHQTLEQNECDSLIREIHYNRRTRFSFSGSEQDTDDQVTTLMYEDPSMAKVKCSGRQDFIKYMLLALKRFNQPSFSLMDVLDDSKPFIAIIMKQITEKYGERFCKAFIRWTIKDLIKKEHSFPSVFTLLDYLAIRLENTFSHPSETSAWDEEYIEEEEIQKPRRYLDQTPDEHRLLGDTVCAKIAHTPRTGTFKINQLIPTSAKSEPEPAPQVIREFLTTELPVMNPEELKGDIWFGIKQKPSIEAQQPLQCDFKGSLAQYIIPIIKRP